MHEPVVTGAVATREGFVAPTPPRARRRVGRIVAVVATIVAFCAILATSLSLITAAGTIFALMAGAGLALAGAAYQGVFRNPMASPSLIGVAGAAYVGVVVATYLLKDLGFAPAGLREALAVGFGVAGVVLVVVLARAAGRGGLYIEDLLLIGMILATFYQAVCTFLAQDVMLLTNLLMTAMGGGEPVDLLNLQQEVYSAMNTAVIPSASTLSNTMLTWFVVPVAVCVAVLLLLRWRITALSFGAEEAQAVGVNAKAVSVAVIACSTVITALVVAEFGMIGWVGLIIPHICRSLAGADFRRVLPLSVLAGGAFLMAVNVVQVTWLWRVQNIGSLCALIGTPIFLYLLGQGRRAWS